MPTKETAQRGQRRSTVVIKIDFEDDNGDAVVPSSARWSLMDENETIINYRSNIAILSLASTVYVVLHGDNTDFLSSEEGEATVKRHLLVQAVYDSSYGDDLPLKDTYIFLIEDLAGVPTSASPSPSPSPSPSA